MSKDDGFERAFTRLRALLAPHTDGMRVLRDEPGSYYVNTSVTNPTNKKPVYFGAVRTTKRYVSFHFMPIYVFPELKDALSPALQKRMQGKSCFNFKAPDEALFSELEQLVEDGLRRYREAGLA